MVTSLQVLFTNKVTVPTTGLEYVIQRFCPFSWICVNANRFENIVMYRWNFLKMQGKNFSVLDYIVV